MNRKKITLSLIAIACAIAVGIGGTLMLFTSVTDVAANVVKLADEALVLKLQEKGGFFLNPDYPQGHDNDGDHYWEYASDYYDIETDGDQVGNYDFYGVEYPDLLPLTTMPKSPRVRYVDGIDSYIRVLSKVNVYKNEGTGATERWVLIAGDDLTTLLGKCFVLNETTRVPELVTATVGEYNTRSQKTLPNGKFYSSEFTVKNNGIEKVYVTFADFLKAVLAGVNTNQFNWEFVELDAANGIYYYVNNGQNPWNQNTNDTADGINSAPLATFGKNIPFNTGDIAATAPLFTEVAVPNFTSAMATILKDYKIALQFEAQGVQAANNDPAYGAWASYFSELDDRISTPVQGAPNPAGSYPAP
ncbi:MAG: SipW-dependent-type signal peptide-containing protein [Clostridiales bacterium]|jgi:predicted ribosomally synthesized peptide with SipW-like signal peptide|nr:SipW-dependent-type signal peptide-containing protein [Clostridiales bacterium]